MKPPKKPRTRPDTLPMDDPDRHARKRDEKRSKARRGMVVESRSVFQIGHQIISRGKDGRP